MGLGKLLHSGKYYQPADSSEASNPLPGVHSASAVALRAAICSVVRMEAGSPPWARVGCGADASAISSSGMYMRSHKTQYYVSNWYNL